MPQLKFKGFNENDICQMSTEIVDELQKIVGCPREYFTLEMINTTNIFDGKIVKTPAFVEIGWFDRGQEIKDQVAIKLTEILKEKEYNELDIVFIEFKEKSYYENGYHF